MTKIYTITADSAELINLISTELRLIVIYAELKSVDVVEGQRLTMAVEANTTLGLNQFDAAVDFVCNIHGYFGKIIWRY